MARVIFKNNNQKKFFLGGVKTISGLSNKELASICQVGCNVRKEFSVTKPTVDFAEAAWIILGDGSITQCQVRITLGMKTDPLYASFVSNLIRKVFGERPSWREYADDNTIELTLSGINLIEELTKWGFRNGDKVRQQEDLLTWIWRNIDFQKACVRGLMDTDCGCYFHKIKPTG